MDRAVTKILEFERDGYYLIRPEMTSLDQIEWVDRAEPLEFSGPGGIYEIIGNGCDLIERVQWAEFGFDVIKDAATMVGWRAEPRKKGKVVSVWLDEEGMYRQPENPMGTAIAQKIGFIDVSNGLWGTLVVACGKAEVE